MELMKIGEVPKQFFGLLGDLLTKLQKGVILIESLRWFLSLTKEQHFALAQEQLELVHKKARRALKRLKYRFTHIIVAVEEFITKEFFRQGKNAITKIWMSDSFEDKIIGKASKKISYKGGKWDFFTLVASMHDSDITKELGGVHTISVDKFLGLAKGLISAQPKGEEGALKTDGYSNIFYVQTDECVFAVSVRWDADDREWSFNCFPFDYAYLWGEGDGVASPAINS